MLKVIGVVFLGVFLVVLYIRVTTSIIESPQLEECELHTDCFSVWYGVNVRKVGE